MGKILLLITAGALLVPGQRTRVELTKATTVKDDSKANSLDVPDVYAIPAKFDRLVVLRFKFDTDLLAGLEKMVKGQKIKNAVFLSGIGSLRGYHVHSVSNRTFPSKNVFWKDPTAPADILSVNGYVIDGKIHGHMTLSTGEKAFGGHIEPGNSVFTFAIITLGVLDDAADLSRVDDKTFR